MKEIDISEVAGIWFHDVRISCIHVDYLQREVKLECTIPVGFWNSPNQYGLTEGEIQGTLVLTGLLYLVMEPPDANYPYEEGTGIVITSAGSVTAETFEANLPKMPQDLPEDAFLHYFYVSEWNASIFVAARGALFRVS